jgi:hypothetical protein
MIFFLKSNLRNQELFQSRVTWKKIEKFRDNPIAQQINRTKIYVRSPDIAQIQNFRFITRKD